MIRAASAGLPGVLAFEAAAWPVPRRSAGGLERRPDQGPQPVQGAGSVITAWFRQHVS